LIAIPSEKNIQILPQISTCGAIVAEENKKVIPQAGALQSGCIYVWEEHSSAEIGLGIERFTDGRKWSPSCEQKVRFQPTFACHLSAQSSYSSFCFTMRSIHCHQILTTMGIVFVFHPLMLNF
jgi:hypothetical protein